MAEVGLTKPFGIMILGDGEAADVGVSITGVVVGEGVICGWTCGEGWRLAALFFWIKIIIRTIRTTAVNIATAKRVLSTTLLSPGAAFSLSKLSGVKFLAIFVFYTDCAIV